MKIFDLIFKRNFRNQDIVIMKKNFKSNFQPFKNEDFNRIELLENIIIKIIHSRCEDLNFKFSYYIENNETRIKLFGDHNFFLDHCKFISISKAGEINKELKLKDDLYFSYSHVYLIFKEYIQFFEIDEKKIDYKLLLAIIEKSQIIKIKDLVNLVNELFFEVETTIPRENKNI
jgi:hypothetical protein